VSGSLVSVMTVNAIPGPGAGSGIDLEVLGKGVIPMMTPAALAGVLLVLAMVWLVVHLVGQSTDRRAVDPTELSVRERAELDALRTLVDDLKELAWDHRELDSPLSVIVIDKIRSHERHIRGIGS
jgi:hypothetical protein